MSFVCVCPPKGLDFGASSSAEDAPKRCNTDQQIRETVDQIHTGAKLILGDGGGLALSTEADTGEYPQVYTKGPIMVAFTGNLEDREYLSFKTKKSDIGDDNFEAELIHALYESYGCRLLGKLRGKYSFALFDSETVRVFAARDPSGKYPLSQARLKDGTLLVANCCLSSFDAEVTEIPGGHYITGGRRCRVPQKFLPKAEELEAAKSAASDAAKRALSGISVTGRGSFGRVSRANSEASSPRSSFESDRRDSFESDRNISDGHIFGRSAPSTTPWRPSRMRSLDGGSRPLPAEPRQQSSNNRRMSLDSSSRLADIPIIDGKTPYPRSSIDGSPRPYITPIMEAQRYAGRGRASFDGLQRNSIDEERPTGRADHATSWRSSNDQPRSVAINPHAAPFIPAALRNQNTKGEQQPKPNSDIIPQRSKSLSETWMPMTKVESPVDTWVPMTKVESPVDTWVPMSTTEVTNMYSPETNFGQGRAEDSPSILEQDDKMVEDGDAEQQPITTRLAMHQSNSLPDSAPKSHDEETAKKKEPFTTRTAITAAVRALHRIASEGSLSRLMLKASDSSSAEGDKKQLIGIPENRGIRRINSCRDLIVISSGSVHSVSAPIPIKRVSSADKLCGETLKEGL